MPGPTSRSDAVPDSTSGPRKSGLRFSAWNLLLLVPLLMLVTPWFNSTEPRLAGMPFFYWSQFAWVPVGVICVAIVFAMTRHLDGDAVAPGEPLDVDDLDEGTAGSHDAEAGR
ncbi:MAG: DUF3311 domain-containing protein [Pseudonocardia sp.]|nr:DUF3311 domain-containing protein [Pseudonocardia sp.]